MDFHPSYANSNNQSTWCLSLLLVASVVLSFISACAWRTRKSPLRQQRRRFLKRISTGCCPSFRLLRDGNTRRRPELGPISEDYGFMPDPFALSNATTPYTAAAAAASEREANARGGKILQELENARSQLPDWYAKGTLHDEIQQMFSRDRGKDMWTQEAIATFSGWELLRIKTILFTIAQAYMDCGRIDSGLATTPDDDGGPLTLPVGLSQATTAVATITNSPAFCTLSDICLNNILLHEHVLERLRSKALSPQDLTYEDMSLYVQVLSGQVPGESEATRAMRDNVEYRFFMTTVEMGYATCDLPLLVATIQQAMYQAISVGTKHRHVIYDSLDVVVDNLKKMVESLNRMHKAFSKITMCDVPPRVWHPTVAKLTMGYNGNGGPSGPQHPSIHLLDVFLGRQKYSSELGEISQETRMLLPSNHRKFLACVQAGPKLDEYIGLVRSTLPARKISTLEKTLHAVIDAYITKGFLGVHRRKAYGYLTEGFKDQGGRTLTAGSKPDEGSKVSIPKQMFQSFTDSINERENHGQYLMSLLRMPAK